MVSYNRFKTWLAVKITEGVSTMECAGLFAILAWLGFPGLHATAPQYIQWVSQTFIQLVMLSILAVAQNQHHQKTQRTLAEHHESTKMELAALHAKHNDLALKIIDEHDAIAAHLVDIHAKLPKPRTTKKGPPTNAD